MAFEVQKHSEQNRLKLLILLAKPPSYPHSWLSRINLFYGRSYFITIFVTYYIRILLVNPKATETPKR